MKSPGILNILEQEYNIPITEELGEEVNDMCNLGEGIAERAEERGRQVGLEQGLERGREEGQLRTLCELVAEGDLSIEKAIQKAAGYGVTSESDLRSRAADLGIQLPET